MSTCAVLLVRDEADVIEAVVRHLAWHVDQIIVADNLSTDGTSEILHELTKDLPLIVGADREPGHYQGQKTTKLAQDALDLGHRWVVPCDADELWYAPEGRRIADWLDAVGRETQFVKAAIYNHVATAKDPFAGRAICPGCLAERADYEGPDGHWLNTCPNCGQILEPLQGEPNPFLRLGWRQRVPLDMRWGKVACRLRPDLEIGEGNHSARTQGVGTTGYGLEIRHFPYRSSDHFTAKAVKGLAALRATDLDESTGAHWRAYGEAIEAGGPEAGAAWFYDAFFASDPEADDSLIYDPVTSILRP